MSARAENFLGNHRAVHTFKENRMNVCYATLELLETFKVTLTVLPPQLQWDLQQQTNLFSFRVTKENRTKVADRPAAALHQSSGEKLLTEAAETDRTCRGGNRDRCDQLTHVWIPDRSDPAVPTASTLSHQVHFQLKWKGGAYLLPYLDTANQRRGAGPKHRPNNLHVNSLMPRFYTTLL